jgi:hypothetical protein
MANTLPAIHSNVVDALTRRPGRVIYNGPDYTGGRIVKVKWNDGRVTEHARPTDLAPAIPCTEGACLHADPSRPCTCTACHGHGHGHTTATTTEAYYADRRTALGVTQLKPRGLAGLPTADDWSF